MAALKAGLAAEKAMDAAALRPSAVRNARALRLQSRAGEMARMWSAADSEHERERIAARAALTAQERRKLLAPPTPHHKISPKGKARK